MENVLGILAIFSAAIGLWWLSEAVIYGIDAAAVMAASAFASALMLFTFMSIVSLLKQIRDRLPKPD